MTRENQARASQARMSVERPSPGRRVEKIENLLGMGENNSNVVSRS
jgi:hypothetical protein